MKQFGISLEEKKKLSLYRYEDFREDPKGLKNVQLEERKLYDDVLDRIIANPRYYLDNLDKLHTFYVTFINYNKKVYK